MLYVYTPRNSTGARDLVEEIMLQGVRARRTKGQLLRDLQPGDAVVCWGSHFVTDAGRKVLNNTPAINKFTEARKLKAAGVPTIEVSETRPAVRERRTPFVPATFTPPVDALDETRVRELVRSATQWLTDEHQRRARHAALPAVAEEIWLPRRNNHVGGADLLASAPATANYWSKKENVVEEYRVHMFNGKSIRAGKKVHKPDVPTHHDWIRSFDAGWIIQYEGFTSTKEMRELAKKAVEALGLNFGAVDIGKKADGSLIVFEVNRAPGIEGGTIKSYASHIISWLNGAEATPAGAAAARRRG